MQELRKREIQNKAALVEDTSMAMTGSLGDMPGVYVKHFYEALGCEGMYRMISGFPDKSGIITCSFGYCTDPDAEALCFRGDT